MINQLHKITHNPQTGWDPVSLEHANALAKRQWNQVSFVKESIDKIENHIGKFENKSVLDIGGGPGQYTIEFSKRGANVIWHDVSNNYLTIASNYAKKFNCTPEFSLGYLEDIAKFKPHSFDFIFVRGAWYYCMNDCYFSSLIQKLLKNNGYCYIITNNSELPTSSKNSNSIIKKLLYFFYEKLNYKIGHPYPPKNKIAEIFKNKDLKLHPFTTNDPDFHFFDELLIQKIL